MHIRHPRLHGERSTVQTNLHINVFAGNFPVIESGKMYICQSETTFRYRGIIHDWVWIYWNSRRGFPRSSAEVNLKPFALRGCVPVCMLFIVNSMHWLELIHDNYKQNSWHLPESSLSQQFRIAMICSEEVNVCDLRWHEWQIMLDRDATSLHLAHLTWCNVKYVSLDSVLF